MNGNEKTDHFDDVWSMGPKDMARSFAAGFPDGAYHPYDQRTFEHYATILGGALQAKVYEEHLRVGLWTKRLAVATVFLAAATALLATVSIFK
jgi:hypothetical protein